MLPGLARRPSEMHVTMTPHFVPFVCFVDHRLFRLRRKNRNDSQPFAGILPAHMSMNFLRPFLFAMAALAILPAFTGCASKDEIAAKRRWETQDERATREVFRENWLLPSVSNEDKEFFYRPFWKRD